MSKIVPSKFGDSDVKFALTTGTSASPSGAFNPVGTPVKAVAKGRVEYTSDSYASYGEIVILNHGDSYYALYAHLSDITVSVGQEVITGQTIGRSGETGSLKGPILHFEVRKGGTALNPEDWLQ